MLTRKDILFHYNANYGDRPIIGAFNDFQRVSASYERNSDNTYTKLIRDTPAVHSIKANDGQIYQALEFRPGALQKVADPFDPSTANWNALSLVLSGHELFLVEDGVGGHEIFEVQTSSGTPTHEPFLVIDPSPEEYISLFEDYTGVYFEDVGVEATANLNQTLLSSRAGTTSYIATNFLVEILTHEAAIPEIGWEIKHNSTTAFLVKHNLETLVTTIVGGNYTVTPTPKVSILDLGPGPNGGILYEVLGYFYYGDLVPSFYFYPASAATSANVSGIFHYAGIDFKEILPSAFEDTVTRDILTSPIFSPQPYCGYLQVIPTLGQGSSNQLMLLFFGDTQDGLAILLLAGNLHIRQYRNGSLISDTSQALALNPYDLLDLYWVHDTANAKIQFTLAVNSVANGTLTANANGLGTFTTWAQNTLYWASSSVGINVPSIYVSEFTAARLDKILPNYATNTTAEILERLVLEFNTLNVGANGDIY